MLKGGHSALWWGCYNGHTKVVEVLAGGGADVECKDIRVHSYIHILIQVCVSHIYVCVCVCRGAQYERSAMMWAAEKGHLGVVKALIRFGADLNAHTNVPLSYHSPPTPYPLPANHPPLQCCVADRVDSPHVRCGEGTRTHR